jgi:hypothetical protein
MNILKSTVCAFALSAVATMGFAEMPKVSDVEVKANLAAIAESDALTYWPDINEDLRAAIASRVEASEDDDAYRVDVSLDEVKLDGLYVLPNNGEFNQMEGVVQVYGVKPGGASESTGETGELLTSYPVKLEAFSEEAPAREGVVRIPPSEGDFYNALINAFADQVVENLNNM